MPSTVMSPEMQALYDKLDQPRRQAFLDEIRRTTFIGRAIAKTLKRKGEPVP